MFVAEDIIQSLYDQHNSRGDEDKEAQIRREFRKAYYELCARTDWELLRIELEYDLTGDGIWLPPRFPGILGIGNTENRWKKASKTGALKENAQCRMWYMDEVSFTPVASGADITIVNGATTFTGGASITTDMIGEYIRIDGQSGTYRLASVTELETPYYGDDLTSDGAYEVRPAGSQKLKLATPSGLTDAEDPTIYLWALPAQIYDVTQLILLPSSEMLEQATSVKLFTITRDKDNADAAKKDLHGSKGRYEGSINRAISMNPEFVMPTGPENFAGTAAGFGSRK